MSIPVAARSLCPYHQRPIRARPPAPVRPRVRTLQARPPACAAPRWRDFGCADVSGNPLPRRHSVPLSPSLRFPGPETEPRVARPLARRFLCFTANHGKTRRKMHLLCKHAAITREERWMEGGTRHSQWRHSTALSLTLGRRDRRGRADERTSIRLYPRSESCIECAPRVGLMEKTHTGSRLC